MTRDGDHRSQQLRRDLPPFLHQWAHHAIPSLAIFSENSHRLAQVALEYHRSPVVQRMSNRRGKVHPLKAVLTQWKTGEKWRSSSHGGQGRSEVGLKSRPRQLHCACPAAGLRLRFEDLNFKPSLRERDGRRQTVRSRANDNRSAEVGTHRCGGSSCGISTTPILLSG